MRTFYRWRDERGYEFCTYVSEPPMGYDGGPLTPLGTLEARHLLEADKIISGVEPDIDPGIRKLVDVINGMPGLMTTSSCEGHSARGDTYANVDMIADNTAAIRNLAKQIQFVDSPRYPLEIRLTISWANSCSLLPDIPPSALDLSMEIYTFNPKGKEKAPNRVQLNRLASDLAKAIGQE